MVGATVMASAPLQFLILLVASWLRRHQGEALEYLRAENRVLRARLGPERLRLTDPERRLLAEKGKPLGRKRLAEVATLPSPAQAGRLQEAPDTASKPIRTEARSSPTFAKHAPRSAS